MKKVGKRVLAALLAGNMLLGGAAASVTTLSVYAAEHTEDNSDTEDIGSADTQGEEIAVGGGEAYEANTASWGGLQKVIDKAGAGATITLTDSLTASPDDTRLVIPKGKEITLDLNGCTLNRALQDSDIDGHVIEVEAGAAFTLMDTSEAQTGMITGGCAAKGGGILNAGRLEIIGGMISGNKAMGGGGIFNADGGNMAVTGGEIAENTAEDGGGIYNSAGVAVISGPTMIRDNTASVSGGGIINAGTLKIAERVLIRNNKALTSGGGIYNLGELNLDGGSVTENTAGEFGGGILYADGSMEVQGTPVVTDNEQDNLFIGPNMTVSMGRMIDQAGTIGITMSNPGIFTTDSKGAVAKYFFSDDSTYAVERVNGEGKLKLAAKFIFYFRSSDKDYTETKAVLSEGTRYTMPGCEFPVPEGKVFGGWLSNDGNIYEEGVKITVSHNKVFVPKWNDITTEEPGNDEPKTEDPTTEEPGSNEPKTEDPTTEEPGSNEPKTEEPGTEEPGSDEPKIEDHTTEEPGNNEPKIEDPTTEEPGSNEPKTEDPTTEESGSDEPKIEDPTTEEPGSNEPKTEEPGTEEPGNKDPKTEEPGKEDPAALQSASVMCDGNLRIRFAYKIADELAGSGKIVFTKNGNETSLPLSEGEMKDGLRFYEMDMQIPEYSDKVSAKIVDADGKAVPVVTADGAAAETVTYSVREYAEDMMKNGRTDAEKAFGKALDDYGKAAQICYKYGDYSGFALSDAVTKMTAAEIKADSASFTGSKFEGLGEVFQTVTFNECNKLRVYFTTENADLTYKLDGNTVQAKKNGGCYCVEIPSVAVSDLSKAHVFEVSNGKDTFQVTTSCMAYAKSRAEKGSDEMQNLTKALYLYQNAAKACFG